MITNQDKIRNDDMINNNGISHPGLETDVSSVVSRWRWTRCFIIMMMLILVKIDHYDHYDHDDHYDHNKHTISMITMITTITMISMITMITMVTQVLRHREAGGHLIIVSRGDSSTLSASDKEVLKNDCLSL